MLCTRSATEGVENTGQCIIYLHETPPNKIDPLE